MESKLVSARERAEEAAADWIARRERGGWTETDDAALQAWIAADFNNRAAWLRLDAAWKQTNRLKALATSAPSGAVPARDETRLPFFAGGAKVDPPAPAGPSRLVAHPRPHSPNRFRALAAGVAIAALATAVLYGAAHRPSFQTAVGALQAVPLSDGSRVTLNTNTEIRVAVTATERRIDLDQGEAYFEVAKDPSRPFVVNAGRQRIVAVGTRFSVRRDAGDTRIFVTEGVVRVESGAPDATLLRAGSIARAGTEGMLVQQKPVAEVELALSWRAGYLIFDQTPLADAVAEFNRYNVHQIAIEDPAVGTIPVGGNFRAANVDAFLRLIESELSVVSARQGNRIVLKGNTHPATRK